MFELDNPLDHRPDDVFIIHNNGDLDILEQQVDHAAQCIREGKSYKLLESEIVAPPEPFVVIEETMSAEERVKLQNEYEQIQQEYKEFFASRSQWAFLIHMKDVIDDTQAEYLKSIPNAIQLGARNLAKKAEFHQTILGIETSTSITNLLVKRKHEHPAM